MAALALLKKSVKEFIALNTDLMINIAATNTGTIY